MIWIYLGLVSAFFASLVAIFGKIGVTGLDSTVVETIRTVIMAIFLVLVSIVFNKTSLFKSVDSRSLFFIFLAGICGSLSWLAYFLALKYGSTSRVTALDRLSIVFIVFFATFIGESLCWQKVVGSLVMIVGAALIAY